MCGIVGYVGYRKSRSVLFDSLKRLEYRGYDSCGIATWNGAGNRKTCSKTLHLYKDVGRVKDVAKKCLSMDGKVGIGHTRWATHGGVTKSNAHPHLDCARRFAVVHNGVIENFTTLKNGLISEGHEFRSDTDSEVIAHLVEKYYRGDVQEAVIRALADLVGTYAIIVLAAGHEELVAARKESPLVVGLGDRENFIASDIAAVLEYTDRVIYLEDDDIVAVRDGSVRISNNGLELEREQCVVPWSVEGAQKAGYEHFMLKEIHEQPKALENTLKGRISLVEPGVKLGVKRSTDLRDVLILACGTSYHAGMIGEHLISRLCHIPSRTKMSSEFDQHDASLSKSWVLGITQSGETLDTLRALKRSKALGCATAAITNVQGSSVTRIAEQVYYTQSGPEIGVAATKTFMAQLAMLYLLAISLIPPDLRDIREYESLIEELRLMPSKIQQVLDTEREIAVCARNLSQYDNAFFIGRGLNYPVAMEGALKLKEISYIHAEAYPAGELKHGPFALLRSNTPLIAIAAKDETYDAMLTSIKEVKARGPQVIALADEGDEEIEQYVDVVIRIPKVNPLFSPFVNSVALQLLAYYAARERNCPIDLPANLAKSVTVP